MKRILIILLMLICLPVQAEQFKQFGNEIVNKHAVTHVRLVGDRIELFYSAGSYGSASVWSTKVEAKDYTDKMKKFNEIKQWLNSKD